MKSLWRSDVALPQFKALTGERSTDVLIIGGGLCGILCAHFLQKAGVHYILVEENSIASGITANTTAKLTFQHGLIYHRLIEKYGKEFAQMYLTANREALKTYKAMCRDINCNFEEKDAYIYTQTDREKIEREVRAVNKLGFDASFCEHTELPVMVRGAIRFPDQAQFHPLKFLSEIAKDLKIYEHTKVTELLPDGARTEQGKIRAKKMIVTTHFPFLNKHGAYFLKLYQNRSYVAAFENVAPLNGMYLDEDYKGLSFRSYQKTILIGAGGHRTGQKTTGWEQQMAFAAQHYPTGKLTHQWAAQDCMSLDGIPYIGAYARSTPNLFVATGFNKWGMTSSMVAAEMLTNLVQEKKHKFSPLFSPQRTMEKKQLFINGTEAVKNLLSPSVKRCPHMGCALKWNKIEHSWDCPCHGSRFSEHGTRLDNPATGDIKSKR